MSTTLADCRILLSKQLGDYWASTSTSDGASDYTSIIDTALKAKSDDWIGDECFTLITEASDSSEDNERKITGLDSNTGALTTLAHTAQITDATAYEIHRLFTASEKRRALIDAAKKGFPYIHKQIWDESKAIDDDYLKKEIDISSLGLAQNRPHQVWQSSDKTDDSVSWYLLRNYTIDKDGKLWLTQGTCGYDLRIIGIGYLDFVNGDGASSTEWDAEIAIDDPQTEILVARAAIYLCQQKVMPTETAGTSESWAMALAYWQGELRDRQAKFGMGAPSATVHWGI